MKISPPIGVLSILGITLTGMAWLAPPPREEMRVSVTMSTETYKQLIQWGRKHKVADDQTPTATRTVEWLLLNTLKSE
jgi:hypothetical protein